MFDIEIPGTEYGDHIRFVFTASHATEYWEEGSEVCFDQLELRPVEYAPVSVESPVEIREEPLYITVASGEMEYRFSRRLSAFDSIKRCGRELLDRPMQFNFFRAPTDNDVMKGDWYGMHLHDSKARNYGVTAEVQGNAAVIRLRQSFGWSIHQPFVYLDVEYRISGRHARRFMPGQGFRQGAVPAAVRYPAVPAPGFHAGGISRLWTARKLRRQAPGKLVR